MHSGCYPSYNDPAFSWIYKLKLHPCVCLQLAQITDFTIPFKLAYTHTTKPQQPRSKISFPAEPFCFVFCGVCFGVASLLGPIWQCFARLRNVITRFKQAKTQHSRSPSSSRFYNTSSHKIIGSPYSRKYKSALFFNNTYGLRGLLDERRFLKLNHMCA